MVRRSMPPLSEKEPSTEPATGRPGNSSPTVDRDIGLTVASRSTTSIAVSPYRLPVNASVLDAPPEPE